MRELCARNLSYVYRQGKREMPVLHDVSATFASGRLYVVTGQGGSGKTTLLQLLAGQIAPESGALELDGRRLRRWHMNRYRRDVATMLFDKNNLMPQMDVAENIAMPLRVHGTARGKAIERALETYLKKAILGNGSISVCRPFRCARN